MSCIEAEQESSSAFSGILFDLHLGTLDSSFYSVDVCILVAIDLLFAEPVGFDALLKFISPLSGLWHVRIHELVA